MRVGWQTIMFGAGRCGITIGPSHGGADVSGKRADGVSRVGRPFVLQRSGENHAPQIAVQDRFEKVASP